MAVAEGIPKFFMFVFEHYLELEESGAEDAASDKQPLLFPVGFGSIYLSNLI